jgi:P-type Cu+ transporter
MAQRLSSHERADPASAPFALTELGITGMTCASCAAHVTHALRSVPGVKEAAVNLATERAAIAHDPGISSEVFVEAVRRAGYDAVPNPDLDRDAIARAKELAKKRKLLIVGVALTVPTLVIGMFAPEFSYKELLLAVLTLPVWGVVGWEFHRGALAALRNGSTTMDTLVSLGSTAALLLSCFDALTGRPTYFESASAIVTLVFAGKYLEAAARSHSNDAMSELLQLRPQTAHRRDSSGAIRDVPADLVQVGDVLIVPPGERVPADGVVLEGESAIDRSMLTGESMPVDVERDGTVAQGTINGDGALTIRATAVGAGTELARIIEIVRRAQGTTPPVQRLADRISSIFVPAILAIAAATFIGWILSHHAAVDAMVAAIAVLVVACPCALGLATPTAVVAGIGVAARRGILFKDAGALERAAVVKWVVFDKTGTLTQGKPRVVNVAPDEAVRIAAALEASSTHPLARAILAAARERGLTIPHASDVVATRGQGIAGVVEGVQVRAGNATFLETAGLPVPPSDDEYTRVFVARETTLLGAIEIGDPVREDARSVVARLTESGAGVALVSGDAPGPVRAAARASGIERIYAEALPERKAEIVRSLQADGARVAFVGDGINDAPALAVADLGFAMGNGTAVALETAGAAILSNDPASIVDARSIAHRTMRTIAQNLFWAFAYNVVLVPLAAAGIVQPVFAAAAMGLSSLFVVGNSLRLSRS